MKKNILILTVGVIFASFANAQSQSQNALTASQAQISACADKAAGDPCEVTNDKGDTLNGICTTDSKSIDAKVFCIPLH